MPKRAPNIDSGVSLCKNSQELSCGSVGSNERSSARNHLISSFEDRGLSEV